MDAFSPHLAHFNNYLVCFLDDASLYFFFPVVDLTGCPEEQILSCNQPDMDDLEGCENQEEEVEAMVEESPSGAVTICNSFPLLHIWGMLILWQE